MDMLSVNAIALVAERKILEAVEQGMFDNLPGYGKPLPEDEFAGLPDEVRLCARILKSASCMDGPDFHLNGSRVTDMLEPGHGEAREAYACMERLALRLKKPSCRGKVPSGERSPRAGRLLDSPYLGRIFSKLF
ncbi:MAG: DUF1992 domain-containing protein [Deltaproteobacteria bacterium]|jgi:hypothetical protein|nr:DUF1992 domain-containing protein [Deltaproteobacteria bacterium]